MEKPDVILCGGVIIDDHKRVLLLYRPGHEHYETPGGKLDAEECVSLSSPSIPEMQKAAEREIYEELGRGIKLGSMHYLGSITFSLRDGRRASSNKFATKILSGHPVINEPETFTKLEYLPIARLEDYPISPDLKLYLPILKAYIGMNK